MMNPNTPSNVNGTPTTSAIAVPPTTVTPTPMSRISDQIGIELDPAAADDACVGSGLRIDHHGR